MSKVTIVPDRAVELVEAGIVSIQTQTGRHKGRGCVEIRVMFLDYTVDGLFGLDNIDTDTIAAMIVAAGKKWAAANNVTAREIETAVKSDAPGIVARRLFDYGLDESAVANLSGPAVSLLAISLGII